LVIEVKRLLRSLRFQQQRTSALKDVSLNAGDEGGADKSADTEQE